MVKRKEPTPTDQPPANALLANPQGYEDWRARRDAQDADMEDADDPQIYEVARAAIINLRAGKHWQWWVDVIRAVSQARRQAMREANTTSQTDGRYKRFFNLILEQEGLDQIDRKTRNHCQQLGSQLAAVEHWRQTRLSTNERDELNHPTSVFRRWKKDHPDIVDQEGVSKAAKPKKQTVKESLAETEQRLHETDGKLHEAEQELANGLREGATVDEVLSWHERQPYSAEELQRIAEGVAALANKRAKPKRRLKK